MLKKIIITALFFTLLLSSAVFAQDSSGKLLGDGIELFKRGLYKQGIINFRDILLNPNQDQYHGDAYFWIAKSYMVLGQLKEAEKNLEYYLDNYKEHPSYSEALYQKGRLFFMEKDYENAIQILSSYINDYPGSLFLSNSYFWIGESLYLLGQLEDSLKIFKTIIEEYPGSYKYEASKYRVSIIEFKKRENELLKLLKWSHMESLKAQEEYQRRERTYEQAISSYQKKITNLTSSNAQAELLSRVSNLEISKNSLTTENVDLKKQIQDLQNQVASLQKNLETLSSSGGSTTGTHSAETTDTQYTERLLAAKEEALAMKAQLLNLLEQSLGGK